MTRTARFRVPAEAVILVVCAAYLASLIAHGRFHQDDFRAYRMAAGEFVAGRPLYFVTGPESPFLYRYAPPVALGFLPFAGLPNDVAALAWYAIDALLVVALWRQLRAGAALKPAFAIVFFAAIGVTLERELGVGNVNLLLLVATLAAIALLDAGRTAASGLALAGTVLAKPPGALALLPLVRRRPAVALAFAACLAVLAALPLPFYGAAGTLALYREYARSLADFQATYGETFKYHATTAGLLERLVGGAGLLLPRAAFLGAGAVVSLATSAAALARFGRAPRATWIALALVPLTATADTNVFVFAAPLVWWLLAERQQARWPRLLDAGLVAALVLFGGNWHDLWGRARSVLFADLGLHGVGTWLLVALAFAVPARDGSGNESSQR